MLFSVQPIFTLWQGHAWWLRGNHFHLVLETPQPNLVAGMQWLLGTFTGQFNRGAFPMRDCIVSAEA